MTNLESKTVSETLKNKKKATIIKDWIKIHILKTIKIKKCKMKRNNWMNMVILYAKTGTKSYKINTELRA